MEKLNGKMGVGIVIKVLVALRGIKDRVADGGTVAAVFRAVMAGGMLLAAGGMVMPAHGDPTGGMPGAAGSAILVPIVLICLIGCLQCPDKLRNLALATSAGPRPEEDAAPVDGTVSPAAPAAPGERAAATMASDARSEAPLASYGFADVSLFGWGFVVLGIILLFLVFLARSVMPLAGAISLWGMGLKLIIQGRQQRDKQALSLYRTYLECSVSTSNCEMRHIPYDRIRKVERRGNRFELYLDDDGETEKVSFSLDQIKDSERVEAREAFEGRMRELGVLHEK